MKLKQAVILAGGLGTRLRPFTNEHPKPMYPFNGHPFIEYLIKQVKTFGIDEVILLLGYKADQIQECLGDGSKYGIRIIYSVTPVAYDTGNRLVSVYECLADRFLLMYCDNYCPIDYNRLVEEADKNDSDVQLSVYANKDGYTKDNLRVDADGKVTVYDKTRSAADLHGVDIGYAIVKKKLINEIAYLQGTVNFEKCIYPECVSNGTMYATVTEHRYYSIGSWQRIELTKQFFNQKKTVFLDRDGTINVRPPKAHYIENPDEFIWLDGAKDAIKLLKDNGYSLILVSNQPGIARGNLTEEMLLEIHNKMQRELKADTGYEIDKIYYCPHNWDEGCDCRKPKPGMLYQAQKEYSLDLTKCIMIGDDERDIEAGEAAGCECFKVTSEQSLYDIAQKIVMRN